MADQIRVTYPHPAKLSDYIIANERMEDGAQSDAQSQEIGFLVIQKEN